MTQETSVKNCIWLGFQSRFEFSKISRAETPIKSAASAEGAFAFRRFWTAARTSALHYSPRHQERRLFSPWAGSTAR